MLSTAIAGEETRAVEVFTAPFFFFPFSAIEGGRILVVKDGGGTPARMVEDFDPDWVPEEGITDSADIVSEKLEREKHLPNYST